MGKKGGSSAPAAPDPVATANAQAAANKETAIAQSQLNMVNQNTPSGSLQYRALAMPQFDEARYLRENPDVAAAIQAGTVASGFKHFTESGNKEGRSAFGIGGDERFDPNALQRYEANISLTPEQQKIFGLSQQGDIKLGEIANAQLGRLENSLSSPLDLSGLPDISSDYSGDRAKVEEAMLARFQPQWERDRASLESQLAAKGFSQGGEGWNRAIDELRRAQTDARMQAVLAGGQEQSRLRGLAETGRQNRMAEMLTARNQPLNEISALMSGSQLTQPSFVNTPQTGVAPTDIIGPTYSSYQGQLNAYNQNQNRGAGLLGSLAGFGGTVLGGWLSDRRAKTDIEKVGKLDNGLNVYSYRYKAGGPPTIGVMAQEVEKKHPDAVFETASGLKAVDYGRAVQ